MPHKLRGRRTPTLLLVSLLVAAGLVTEAVPGLGPSAAAAATCPCSIWPSTAAPANASAPDSSAVEVGVKVRSDTAGYITAVRFWKGSGNGGTHVGSLWSTSGTQLASATFTGETATGWQQVSLATPVAITANTTYVASYYAPQGHYAADNNALSTAGVDNAPLHALANGVDGGDGVYRYGTGGGFPASTYQSTNYWVDVVYSPASTDTTPPVLTSRTPAAGATGVPVSTQVSGTFSEDVAGAQVSLTRAGTTVPGTTSYDGPSRTVTFAPTSALATSTAYVVTVTGARDAAGNLMTADSWTFTTGTTASLCPCSLWPASATPATASQADSSAVEVGTRFTSSTNGYITALRYYRGPSNPGPHVGHLWTATGTLLSSATFTGESATGWQQVTLPAPVAVTAGTAYVASYYAPSGGYAVSGSYFTTARSSPPLTAPASTTTAPNGVYGYGASGFPTSTFKSTSYWVDVVFDTTATDRTAPMVTSRSPAAGATGVDAGTAVTATFSEAVDSTTLSFQLTGGGTTVAATTSYDARTSTATLTPTAALAAGTTYTASVSASDLAGNAMSSPVTWTFTTGTPTTPPTTDGPVLVVAPSTASFGRYLPEILKAEGLNEYAVGDLSTLTTTTLARYDVVLLADTALTAAQVSTLTTWVNGGGNLIAMRPDKQLAGLLGLTPVTSGGTTLTDGYVQVSTGSGPGVGITDQTIQFHGTADRYTTSGATVVATLYSGPTTATANPAVTVRDVGTQGGSAAAFTYDLARSVVYTRQGNPAFAGQERDNQPPIRSDDLFWGSTAQNGYLNLDKVAIPQADEQQRLLANLVETVNRDRKPLPRFWYFPRMAKAVVIGTGDDHGNGGTAGRFDEYLANSAPGCSVVLWSCLRSTSYVFTSTPLTNSQALSYTNSGFEVGLHPQNGCTNYTSSSLENDYATQLAAWQAKYSSLPAPVTNRYHCMVWSDWSTQPATELRHGIGMDMNYYYWPPTWLNDRPGFMTGSGLPMRFANTDGSVLNVFQAATQMTDESGQSYPATPDTLFANALGPLGYYGAFTANEHTDQPTTYDSDQLIASALAHGVPIVTGRQMLTWLQGRDASAFTGLSWSGSSLSFTVQAGAGATGLSALLPTASASGSLTGITRGGSAVAYTTQTIKGVAYAVFSAAEGAYTATYGGAAPVSALVRAGAVSGPASTVPAAVVPTGPQPMPTDVRVVSLPDGTVTAQWRTARATDSVLEVGSSSAALDVRRRDPAQVTDHSVVLTELVPGATYFYRVGSSEGAAGSTASSVQRFVQSALGVAQTTAASFRAGTGDGTYVASTTDGELQLAGAGAAEFDRMGLPSGWTVQAGGKGGAVVGEGVLRLEGAGVTGPAVGTTQGLTFGATFTGSDQAVELTAGPGEVRAAFATKDGHLVARIGSGPQSVQKDLPDLPVGSPHAFGIARTRTGLELSVDGVAVIASSLPGMPTRLVASDARPDGDALVMDWVRPSARPSSASYLSPVLDAQQMVTWDRASWDASLPPGTSLHVSVRTGSRPVPDGSWERFQPLPGAGSVIGSDGRYLQYRVTLATADSSRTPVLYAIGFTHNGRPFAARPMGKCGEAPAPCASTLSMPPAGPVRGAAPPRPSSHTGTVAPVPTGLLFLSPERSASPVLPAAPWALAATASLPVRTAEVWLPSRALVRLRRSRGRDGRRRRASCRWRRLRRDRLRRDGPSQESTRVPRPSP